MHVRFLPTTQITVMEDRVQIQHRSRENSDSVSLFWLKEQHSGFVHWFASQYTKDYQFFQ